MEGTKGEIEEETNEEKSTVGQKETNEEKIIRVPKLKLEWDGELINNLIGKLNEDKENYNLTLTNYTCLIETEDIDYHFLKHMQKPIVFGVFRELKRFMDTHIGDNDIPYIDRDKMKYYSVKIINKPMYRHKAYNIDINAAYPTCLYVNKLIDGKLYDRLMKLDKDERLASIGMMAARKRRFTFTDGVVTDYIDDQSEYAKYFFFCVQTISKIIWECEIVAGTSFIYSWVDGLYLTCKKSAEKCKRLLTESGYNSTIAELADFQYTPDENKIVISFIKDRETKLFNIPVEKNSLTQILKHIHS